MTAATDVIEGVIERRGDKTPAAQAKLILTALETLGFAVMAPEDLEWGECFGGGSVPGSPHRISLSLCAGCLEYDPE